MTAIFGKEERRRKNEETENDLTKGTDLTMENFFWTEKDMNFNGNWAIGFRYREENTNNK